MLLNPPHNSYLPLDYDLKWVEGGAAFAPTMERHLHEILLPRKARLFCST